MEIWEILNNVDKAKAKSKKIKILLDNDSVALRSIMRLNFDPDLILYINNEIDWTPAPNSSEWYTTLKSETKNLVPLIKLPQNSNQKNRNTYIFADIIGAMDPKDSKVLLDAKDKNLKVKGLTLKLAEEIWGRRIFN